MPHVQSSGSLHTSCLAEIGALTSLLSLSITGDCSGGWFMPQPAADGGGCSMAALSALTRLTHLAARVEDQGGGGATAALLSALPVSHLAALQALELSSAQVREQAAVTHLA
jgi:hypothetical protein